MAWHAFGPHVAVDATTGHLVADGFGYVVPSGAAVDAPALAVTDLSGVAYPSGLIPVVGGLVAGFRVEDHLTVEWVSGGNRVPIWSPAAFEAAAAAAAEAAIAAAGPSEDVGNVLTLGTDGRLLLAPPAVLTPATFVAALEDDESAVRTVLDAVYVAAGNYARVLVLEHDAEVPESTPSGTVVLRLPEDVL